MAKRKKSSRPTRRGRVGFVKMGGDTSKLLMMGGGGILGGMAANMLGNAIGDKLDPKMVALVKVGAGVIVAGKSKSPLMQGVGLGAVINGGTDLARSTGMMSGITNPFLSAYQGGTYALSGVDAAEPVAPNDEVQNLNGLIPEAQFDASGIYHP